MKLKFWLNIITFVALIAIIIFAWTDIIHALEKITTLNIWVLLLIIPAQFFAFYSLGQVFHYFFKATGVALTMKQLFAPMLELNFVNHVFPSGGASGFSYLTLRLKPYGVSPAKSTLAQLGRFVSTFLAFVGLMFVALFILSLQGDVNPLVVFAVSSIAFTVLFSTAVLVFVVGRESRIDTFTKTLTMWINRGIHIFRRKHPETISLRRVRTMFLELHEDYLVVRQNPKAMWPVMRWAVLTNLAEASLLYIAFMAHGELVNPGAVLIALVVANLVGLVSILPGGVGLYEPLMTAVLISGGIPAGLALSATLVYRVLSLLVSLITGYVLYHRALNRYGSHDTAS
ncbi:MAG TPA: lysylphosphatidylglycerol synthase transmembrane domain-containing protein [Magnetospirillaceae bacterium]|nr:lysylphosphatidylglycerol synthase transmembrane domain-containing protein [Magnetospirillaceae bacterium]